MSTTIIDYWKSHRSFWITITPEKQKDADEEITKIFGQYDITNENLIGKIIYLDQFSRHFQRKRLRTEEDVINNRIKATELVKSNINQLYAMNETEIIFALMPFKHLGEYEFIFEYLHNEWFNDNGFPCELSELQRFYIDTYRKAYTFENIKKNIITEHKVCKYDPEEICEVSYGDDELDPSFDWDFDPESYPMIKALNEVEGPVTVSLSGGVDSMVMLYVLKNFRTSSKNVNAVHIIYGNREVSDQEYSFVVDYCRKLDVKLYTYRIEWLRRDIVDRNFYESMTRQIRFMVYRAVGSNVGSDQVKTVCSDFDLSGCEPRVLLGHLKDDVVENIWSNITKCHHLDNLKKMEKEESQMGVTICRPLLDTEKDEIYKLSYKIKIPYLKNTTPSWSNRGKFREHFHDATIKQFGESIDNKIIEFAEAVQTQNRLIHNLLFEPIYNSFRTFSPDPSGVKSTPNGGEINVTNAITSKIDTNMWLIIFEHICHKYLRINRPGNKAVHEFWIRVSRTIYSHSTSSDVTAEMSKQLKVRLYNNQKHEWTLEFINK